MATIAAEQDARVGPGWPASDSDASPRQRHDAFFRILSQAVCDADDAGRIITIVSERVRAHLGVALVLYSEPTDAPDVFLTRHGAGAGKIRERLPAAFTPTLRAFAAGHTVASTDVASVGGLISPEVRDHVIHRGSRAAVAVPLVKGGRLAAVLTVHHPVPRDWTPAEIALIEDVAELSWSNVTRAEAEAARLDRARHDGFLIEWSDALSHRPSAAVLPTALDLLGRHLGAAELVFAEAVNATFVTRHEWRTRKPNAVSAIGQQEEPFTAPVVRDERIVAELRAHAGTARQWTEAEEKLLCDVAERIWTRLDRARLEARLAESEATLAAFMEHAPVGMHLKDAHGRYLRINPELAVAIDRPPHAILGRHPDEMFTPEIARRIAALEARARTGAPAAEEFVTEPRDRYASLLSITFPIPGDHAAKTGGFTLDLTERKSAEAALQRSRDALYQSEKLSALGSLLAGVSHELNNPLSIVVAQAVMMERQATGTDLAERAFKIRKAADRCARIVQTFLAMARQKRPERTAVDLNTVANSAIELASYGLRSDGVGITRAFAPRLPRISADGDQLHQIVTNLIVNAQQAMAGQSSLRWLEVRTALGPEPRTVILEVADSGPGIPADLRRRIFEPFYTTKPQGEGTGVGLSFSQGLAEAHGGRLTLGPSEKGACFRLTLPFDETDLLARTEPVAAKPPPATLRRALIVDDEEEIAASLADFLSIEGFECEVVVGGAAAQARLAQGQPYDLIVSDIRMPGVDGPALFAWIVAQRPELAPHTAFTTGDTLGNAAARFIADCGRPVLEKPFMPDSVRHFLAELDAE